jgi:hypothetical protein
MVRDWEFASPAAQLAELLSRVAEFFQEAFALAPL